MTARTIRAVIDAQAAATPDAPFLLAPEPGVTISYGALRDICQAIGGELAAAGIPPGEVVSFLLENGVSAATIFLGAMYAGYVVAPMSLLAQDAQLEYILAHSGTRLVFAEASYADRLRDAAARAGSRAIVRPTRSRRARLRPAVAAHLPAAADFRHRGPADVHVGNDRAAQGCAAVAPQPRARARCGRRRTPPRRPPTACCRRCRSTTSTVNASPSSRRSCREGAW